MLLMYQKKKHQAAYMKTRQRKLLLKWVLPVPKTLDFLFPLKLQACNWILFSVKINKNQSAFHWPFGRKNKNLLFPHTQEQHPGTYRTIQCPQESTWKSAVQLQRTWSSLLHSTWAPQQYQSTKKVTICYSQLPQIRMWGCFAAAIKHQSCESA